LNWLLVVLLILHCQLDEEQHFSDSLASCKAFAPPTNPTKFVIMRQRMSSSSSLSGIAPGQESGRLRGATTTKTLPIFQPEQLVAYNSSKMTDEL
jgi:hypothetical protein